MEKGRTEMDMMFRRVWAMPSVWTFAVKPIGEIVNRYVGNSGLSWVDPFAGKNTPAGVTNDIVPGRAKFAMDAIDFLKMLPDGEFGGVLFDPPYSVEQCLRRYTPKQGGTAGRAEYWARCKDEIARILCPGAIAISCCWDSTGIGKGRGFEIIEGLVVCHGACHNDTIVTVEMKVREVSK